MAKYLQLAKVMKLVLVKTVSSWRIQFFVSFQLESLKWRLLYNCWAFSSHVFSQHTFLAKRLNRKFSLNLWSIVFSFFLTFWITIYWAKTIKGSHVATLENNERNLSSYQKSFSHNYFKFLHYKSFSNKTAQNLILGFPNFMIEK